MTTATNWPNTDTARATALRVRAALASRGLTLRDLQKKAEERTPVSYNTLRKTIRGGCRSGDAGLAVRWALRQLLREDATGLFDEIDAGS